MHCNRTYCFSFALALQLVFYFLSLDIPISDFVYGGGDEIDIEQAAEEKHTREVSNPEAHLPANAVQYVFPRKDGTPQTWFSTTVRQVRVLREPNSGNEAFTWNRPYDMGYPLFTEPGKPTPKITMRQKNSRGLPNVDGVPLVRYPRAIVVFMLACVTNYHHAWSDTFIPYYHRALSR
eukprot:PhF_6_TR23591/c0_g1_i1/m.33108